jgi:predicted metal-dependent peptidase
VNHLPPLLKTGLTVLYAKNPFYAMLCSQEADFIRDDKIPAIAGVCYKNNRILLKYNLEMLESKNLTPNEMSDIIYHELRHVVNGDVFGENRGLLWNICQDMSINSNLHSTATKLGGVTVTAINEKYDCNLETDKTSQHYHAYLSQIMEKEPEDISGFDDHSEFEDSDKGETVKAEVSQKIKNVFEQMKRTHASRITGSLLEELDSHIKSKVNWKKQFRNIVQSALSSSKRKTRSRLNRRLGHALQGTKKEDKFKITVCVDTSASMSNQALSQCWSEINSLYKNVNCDIIVIEADCEVQNVKPFEPKQKPAFTGRGGTSYNPAILKAKELKPDLIVFLGDFGCFDNPEDPKISFLWVGIGVKTDPPANFGKVIYVE